MFCTLFLYGGVADMQLFFFFFLHTMLYLVSGVQNSDWTVTLQNVRHDMFCIFCKSFVAVRYENNHKLHLEENIGERAWVTYS